MTLLVQFLPFALMAAALLFFLRSALARRPPARKP
jgi:hypothetical protein